MAAAASRNDSTTTTTDILQHAIEKAVCIAQQVFEVCCKRYTEQQTTQQQQQQQGLDGSSRSHGSSSNHSNSEAAAVDARRDGQAAIARITELNLIFRSMLKARRKSDDDNNTEDDDTNTVLNQDKIIELYVQFQRQTLRQRAKPAIAALVQERRKGTFQQQQNKNDDSKEHDNSATAVVPPVQGGMTVLHHSGDSADNDNDDDNEHPAPPQQQHHAPVLTVILGEAAALIHPLAAWMMMISSENNNTIQKLCQDSIATLNDQAQSLAKTVSDWFWQDRPVEHWMQQSSNRQAAATAHNTTNVLDESALAKLDALVEEMAYTCQVFERYQTLMDSIGMTEAATTTTTTVIAKELLPEWTWKYGALERFLALQFWQAALSHAVPVTIVLGTSIRVPSVVEDAQYLSTRALQRAATTKSRQAIATVAYAVSHDVWSTEQVVVTTSCSSSTTAESTTASSPSAASAVYQALLDQMGCWSDEQEVENNKKENGSGGLMLSSPPQSSGGGGFASALLDALDDDDKGKKDITRSCESCGATVIGQLSHGTSNRQGKDAANRARHGFLSVEWYACRVGSIASSRKLS